MVQSLEQQIRDILDRMDIEGAQEFTSGDMVELANLLHDKIALEKRCEEVERERDRLEFLVNKLTNELDHTKLSESLAHHKILEIAAENALLRKRLEPIEVAWNDRSKYTVLEYVDVMYEAIEKCMALKEPTESNGK